MIVLHHGSGSTGFEIESFALSDEQWIKKKELACELLRARKHVKTADLFESVDFDLLSATNFFNDEFAILYTEVPAERYVELEKLCSDPNYKRAFGTIAETVSEIGPYVRIVAVEVLEKDKKPNVPEPSLRTTSKVVEQSLSDSRRLLSTGSAISAVDRVHTALHGYMKQICSDNSIDFNENASLVELYKKLRQEHASFKDLGPRSHDINKILRSLSATIDAVNTIRNMASVAHPNRELLQEPEALLVINSVHTIFNFICSKIEAQSR